MKIKPYLHAGRFYNHKNDSLRIYLKSMLVTLKHFFRKRVPYFPNGRAETLASWTTAPSFNQTAKTPTITWLGHASFLIQLEGINIVTDPVFGEMSKIFSRMIPSPLTTTKLPKIDVVIISHNHFDHLDIKSLKELTSSNPLFLVPQGNKKLFNKHGFNNVNEFSWWDQYTLQKQENNLPVTLQFLPAQHWSGRSIFDMNKSLWGSWLITSERDSIYFAGDTAFGEHFKNIREHCNNIDIAILPIAPCIPEQGMQPSHINPEQSLLAFNILNAKHFIPMHWGTFRQGHESFNYAIDLLTSLWQKNIPQDCLLHILKSGETKSFINK